MSKIRLYGDTSGYMDITVPATADNSAMDLSTVGDVRSDQTNSFTARQNITGGASGRYGPYEDALRVKGNTYSYLEIEGTNSQAGLILNKDNSTGYGIGISNQGRLKLKPIASIDSTGLGNWKDQNTSGLEIDTNGLVTKPAQTSFLMRGSAGVGGNGAGQYTPPVNNTARHNFSIVEQDRGSNISNSNSRFTAPVAGDYYINWQPGFGNNSSGTSTRYMTAAIWKNGAQYINHNQGQIEISDGWGSGNSYWHMVVSAVIYLNANDYIEFTTGRSSSSNYNGTVHGDTTWAFGYLLG